MHEGDAAQDLSELQRADARHHIHPFTASRELADEGTTVIVGGDGVHVEDSEGNRLIDGLAGLWCVQLGYGRRELADAAREQLARLAYYNTFFKTSTPPVIELSRRLAELAPGDIDCFLFANSGSEAVDSAVRLIRHYWELRDRPEKRVIVSREHGYHGSTLAAASVGGWSSMHEQGSLPLEGFEHVIAPYWYVEGRDDESRRELGLRAARALEERILELGPDRVAAFFGEPVMGAGGVLVPPDGYWDEVQRICREHEVLLVADEVICGFGRLGTWWGCDRYGIRPDLVTMAKGLSSGYVPISALGVGPAVADTLIEAGVPFKHGFTYSGHPVAAAVALENLRILEEEGVVDRVRDDVGPYLQERLRETAGDHPLVGEIRGDGLIAACELVADRERRERFEPHGAVGEICFRRGLANGVIARAIHDVMALSPPLTIERREIDRLVDGLVTAFDETREIIETEGVPDE